MTFSVSLVLNAGDDLNSRGHSYIAALGSGLSGRPCSSQRLGRTQRPLSTCVPREAWATRKARVRPASQAGCATERTRSRASDSRHEMGPGEGRPSLGPPCRGACLRRIEREARLLPLPKCRRTQLRGADSLPLISVYLTWDPRLRGVSDSQTPISTTSTEDSHPAEWPGPVLRITEQSLNQGPRVTPLYRGHLPSFTWSPPSTRQEADLHKREHR